MARIFHIRLNLDDMAATLDTLEGDAEHAEWLRGFRSGVRGGPCRWKVGAPGQLGHALGAASLAESEAFRALKVEGGKRSAESRKERYGSSNPREHKSNTTETQHELEREQTREQDVNHPISNIQYPIESSEGEAPPPPAAGVTRPKEHWPHIQRTPWYLRGIRAGCRISASNWPSWAGAIARTGDDYDLFFEKAESMPPDKRWFDKIEAAISEQPRPVAFSAEQVALFDELSGKGQSDAG